MIHDALRGTHGTGDRGEYQYQLIRLGKHPAVTTMSISHHVYIRLCNHLGGPREVNCLARTFHSELKELPLGRTRSSVLRQLLIEEANHRSNHPGATK